MESKYFFAIKYLLINENLWCWKTLNVYKSTSSTHGRCNSLSLEGYHVVLRAIWKIDVHLIGTLVNKSLYYTEWITHTMICRVRCDVDFCGKHHSSSHQCKIYNFGLIVWSDVGHKCSHTHSDC